MVCYGCPARIYKTARRGHQKRYVLRGISMCGACYQIALDHCADWGDSQLPSPSWEQVDFRRLPSWVDPALLGPPTAPPRHRREQAEAIALMLGTTRTSLLTQLRRMRAKSRRRQRRGQPQAPVSC